MKTIGKTLLYIVDIDTRFALYVMLATLLTGLCIALCVKNFSIILKWVIAFGN